MAVTLRRVVETDVFYARARQICSDAEVKEATAFIASDPAIGLPFADLGGGVREYVFTDLDMVVMYMVSHNFSEVLFINAVRDGIERKVSVTGVRRARELILTILRILVSGR